MAPGKKIIRRKPGSAPSVNYFTMKTQDAIVLYKETESRSEREKIYVKDIFPAFKTLVENLINVYKYQIQYESKEDLRTECLEFLYTVITKFDASKGSKAFSYFNVIARNWLTIKSKQNAKLVQTFASLDDRDAFSNHEIEMIEGYSILPSPDDMITHEEQIANFRKLLTEVKVRTKTPNELLCIEAIELIFGNVENLDIINKRAVMIYIRNITNLSPKQLSIVLSTLKKHYKCIRTEEHDN